MTRFQNNPLRIQIQQIFRWIDDDHPRLGIDARTNCLRKRDQGLARLPAALLVTHRDAELDAQNARAARGVDIDDRAYLVERPLPQHSAAYEIRDVILVFGKRYLLFLRDQDVPSPQTFCRFDGIDAIELQNDAALMKPAILDSTRLGRAAGTLEVRLTEFLEALRKVRQNLRRDLAAAALRSRDPRHSQELILIVAWVCLQVSDVFSGGRGTPMPTPRVRPPIVDSYLKLTRLLVYSRISSVKRFFSFIPAAPRIVRMERAVRPCFPITFPRSDG